MPITALPDAPNRNQSPEEFADKGDALLGALPGFVNEANALQADVNAKAVSAAVHAEVAEASAGLNNFKGDWDGAAAYAIGDSVSRSGFYWIAIEDGAGNEPVEGSTQWKLLVSGKTLHLVGSGLPNEAYTKEEIDESTSLLYREFWVDATNGDDTNNGSELAPFATVKKAVDMVPIGGMGKIYLAINTTYVIDEDVEVLLKKIDLVYASPPPTAADRPLVLVTRYDNGSHNYAHGFSLVRGSGIFSSGINYGVTGPHNASLEASASYCIFRSSSSSTSLHLRGSDIDMGSDNEGKFRTLTVSTGYAVVSTYLSHFVGVGTVAHNNAGSLCLSVSGGSKDAAIEWTGGSSAILSNV